AAVGPQPLQHIDMSVCSRTTERRLVARAAVIVQPLHDFEVTVFGGCTACTLVPRAAVVPQELQHFEMSIFGGYRTCIQAHHPERMLRLFCLFQAVEISVRDSVPAIVPSRLTALGGERENN
ncbi:unnamed protein product, partial [Scytosiphon promiscuus]